MPFSLEPVAGTLAQEDYICAFTEPVLHSPMRGVSLKESVLYRVDGNPVYNGALKSIRAYLEREREQASSVLELTFM